MRCIHKEPAVPDLEAFSVLTDPGTKGDDEETQSANTEHLPRARALLTKTQGGVMVCDKANNGNERKEGIWGAGNQTMVEQAVRVGARTQGPLCPSWRQTRFLLAQMPAVLRGSRWPRASLSAPGHR